MFIPDRCRSAGLSLVELVIFIVIVGGAVIGILSVMNVTTAASADPMVRKQALAIAESLLEEIELMPFTFCDPDDPLAATALAGACTGGADGANDENAVAAGVLRGPELAGSVGGAEGRYATPRFDNVSDYNGFTMSGTIKDITFADIAGLGAYTVTVIITRAGTSPFSLPNAAVLQIDVRVQAGTAVDITLTGYRFRYAPNAF
jgi:MSHA pilin protein MshD